MHIHCLGLNHETADLSIRERLAFSEENIKIALARLGCGEDTQPDSVSEMVILSTCNRVEIYAIAPQPSFEALEAFLAEVQDVPVNAFEAHVYRLLDEDAIEHLFQVAAGLDSLVLGEPQILGQVMEAFEIARGQDTVGAVLSRLFQSALHTGKRARTETAISHNPASISSVAVHLAAQVVPDLERARVTVVGAGEMAELAVEALRKRGTNQLRVVNRTLERASNLANRWGGEAATFEKLDDALGWADIVITSTGAPHTLIRPEMVAPVLPSRKQRPLVFIDIAVPRDVEMEVGALQGVRLFDIDMLHEHLEHSLASREREVPRVENILEEEKQAFLDYLRTLDVVPLIAELNQQFEQIRKVELEKTLKRLPDLGPEGVARLEALTQAMVKKMLHQPITRLRSEAGSPQGALYAATARNLFGLESQVRLRKNGGVQSGGVQSGGVQKGRVQKGRVQKGHGKNGRGQSMLS
jgi:glutamyl-tRNA reductase